MKSSLIKSWIFSGFALGLLLYFFVIPAVFTHNIPLFVQEYKPNYITPIATKVWNFYDRGRYIPEGTPKKIAYNLKELISNNAEVSSVTVPVWYVSLEAPQYPKKVFPNGVPVFYHFDGFSGDVNEMNTINHYIGMDPMDRGAPYLRMVAPYALVFTALLIVLFMLYKSKIFDLFMLVPISLPFLFLGFYTYWLYWFGHNMHRWGAFHIKSFTPTILGDGKVAQFVTHSFPTSGFWILVAISILSILAVASKLKAMKIESQS